MMHDSDMIIYCCMCVLTVDKETGARDGTGGLAADKVMRKREKLVRLFNLLTHRYSDPETAICQSKLHSTAGS